MSERAYTMSGSHARAYFLQSSGVHCQRHSISASQAVNVVEGYLANAPNAKRVNESGLVRRHIARIKRISKRHARYMFVGLVSKKGMKRVRAGLERRDRWVMF